MERFSNFPLVRYYQISRIFCTARVTITFNGKYPTLGIYPLPPFTILLSPICKIFLEYNYGMCKCVYCLKVEPETTFCSREHVISQFLGGFEPTNPHLQGDLVCDNCNSLIFSRLETNFKEDSYEGLFAQMLNLENSGSVRIKGKNIDIKTVMGFGDGFFNEIFPFLKYENDKLVVDFKPQLKINNYAEGYQIFTYESLQKIKAGGKAKLNKIRKRLSLKPKTDIAIFAGSKYGDATELDKFIKLLPEFGITYNEKTRKYTANKNSEGKPFEVDVKCEINSNLMRFIAKMAFNYFIYCAEQEGGFYTDLLYDKHFDQIRDFVCKGIGNWKDIVKFSKTGAILNIEENSQKRILAHTILFTINDNKIKAKVSIFGNSIYEVIIGKYPLKLDIQKFGCGHIFEPFSRKIFAISPKPHSLNRLLDNGYGWFKV